MYRYLALFLTAMIINGEVVAGERPDGSGDYWVVSVMTCGKVSDMRRNNALSSATRLLLQSNAAALLDECRPARQHR